MKHNPPPRVRPAWYLLGGALVLLPAGGLVLLVIPQPWKAGLVFVLIVVCLAGLGRLVWLSRSGQK